MPPSYPNLSPAAGGPPRAAAAASPFAAPAGGSGGQLGGPINYLSLEGAEAAAEYWRGGLYESHEGRALAQAELMCATSDS